MWFCLFILLACTGIGGKGENKDSVEEEGISFTHCEQTINHHPCDFSLKNQDGEFVNLYDFYGKPIVLDFSTSWCFYCVVAADSVQSIVEQHAESNVKYITVLIENEEGNSPTVANAKEWAIAHGIVSEEVLVGSRDMINIDPNLGWYVEGWPSFYFLDSEMVLRGYLRGYSEESIEAGIELISSAEGGL